MYKTIKGTLPWADRTEWLLPSADKNTIDWPFTYGPTDIDPALEMMDPYLKGKRTCIQAGGCIGIWPTRLSQVFEHVHCFEPEPVNFQCLKNNTAGIENLTLYESALGKESSLVHMELTPRMIGHCGAYQAKAGGDIPMIRIDDLNLPDVDLIYLDIEGGEYDALTGAMETINRDHPVIGIEDKGWNDPKFHPRSLLTSLGYRLLGAPNKADKLYIHEATAP